MSYWEVVPFDILASILPYLDFDDSMIIEALSGDECLKRRLQIEDPNGHIWKYIYTQKLSRDTPIGSKFTYRQIYYDYNQVRHNIDSGVYRNYNSLAYIAMKGYEIWVENLLKQSKPNKAQITEALVVASSCGHLNTVKVLIAYGATVSAHNSLSLDLASWNIHHDVVGYLKSVSQ